MSQTILFRFSGSDQVDWMADDGAPERGSLADLAVQAAGQRMVLAAAGEAVILTQAQVPGRNRATWMRAVPYALEEHLAEDVEDMHFALGAATPDGVVSVATMHRETLSGWLAACADANIVPSAVIPEPLLVPFDNDTWTILVDGRRALVRCGPADGFACELDCLPVLLELTLAEAGEHPPQRIRVWGGELPEQLSLPVETSVEEVTIRPLAALAAGLAGSPPTIDLLQGAFSRRTHIGKWIRPWRMAAALAGIWLALQVGLQVSEYWVLSREHTALELEMEQIYKDAVPNARKIVNPRAQLESQLQALRGEAGASEQGFLALLVEAGRSLTALADVELNGLRYKDGQLDLSLEGGTLEVLDRLKQQLAEQSNLDIQMRTSKREGRVESQLVLRRTSS